VRAVEAPPFAATAGGRLGAAWTTTPSLPEEELAAPNDEKPLPKLEDPEFPAALLFDPNPLEPNPLEPKLDLLDPKLEPDPKLELDPKLEFDPNPEFALDLAAPDAAATGFELAPKPELPVAADAFPNPELAPNPAALAS
jgi:hypothetical protein